MPDFKTVYEEDKGAASDVTSEFYVGAVKVDSNGLETNVGVNTDQLASIISEKLGGIPATTASSLVITIADNTLIYDVQPISSPLYEYYMFTSNNTTAPTLVSSGWIQGPIILRQKLSAWAAETIRLYVHNGIDVTEILDIDGTSGIIVTPRDTLSPTTINDFVLSAGGNAESEVIPAWTAASDAGTDVQGYNIWTGEPDAPVTLLSADFTSGDTLDVSPLFAPGDSVSLFVEAYDGGTPPNLSSSNSASITLASIVSGGIIGLSLSEYSEDDNAGPLVVTLVRSTSTVGAVSVNVSTRDRLDANNEPLVKGGIPYTFNSGTGVDSGTDVISLDSGDPWITADPVTYSKDGGSQAIGVADTNTYYVRRTGVGTYTLHANTTDANAGANALDLTAGGSETQILYDGAEIGYEKIVSETVNWGDGVSTNQTVNVKLVTRAVQTNDIFQFEIDHDNVVGCSLGSIISALCTIDSSATGTTGFQQESLSPYVISVEMENSNRVANEGADPAYLWYEDSNNRASGGVLLRPNSAAGEVGTVTTLDFGAQSVDYPIAFKQIGDHTLSVRAYHATGGAGQTGHAALLRPIASIGAESAGSAVVTLTENHDYTNGDIVYHEDNDLAAHNGSFTVANQSGATYEIAVPGSTAAATAPGNAMNGADLIGIFTQNVADSSVDFHGWCDTDESAVLREVNIPATGEWTLRFYQQDYNWRADKFVLWPTYISYDPSVVGNVGVFARDENMGPAVVPYLSTTAAIDNTENPNETWKPLPNTTLAATALIPANAATFISTSTPIRITFESGATQLDIQTFIVSANNSNVAGDFTAISSNEAIWTPASSNLIASTTYTLEVTGTIVDSTGTYKAITAGTWAFTTIDADDTLMDIDFSYNGVVSEPTELFIYDLGMIFGSTGVQIIKSTSLPSCELAPDPAANGTRGNVLKITHPKGTIKDGIQVIEQLSGGQRSEIWCSYDMFLPDTYIFPAAVKVFAGLSSIRPGTIATPDSDYYSCRPSLNNSSVFSGHNDGAMSAYWYNFEKVYQSSFWADPDTGGDFVAPLGRWFEIKYKLKMNTTDAVNGGIECWVDGRQVLNRSHQFTDTDLPGGFEWLYLIAKYGGPSTDPRYESPQDQSEYYDNLRIWVP